ncbi:MAG: hypothetical protein U0936_27115 [Planctomycetaceae bacterium]
MADLDKPVTQVNSATANATGLFTLAVSGGDVGGSQLAAFDFVSIDNAAAVLIGSVSGKFCWRLLRNSDVSYGRWATC